MASVTIPNKVSNIGDWMFGGCWRLATVTIPTGVTNIGHDAFRDCAYLTNLTMPNSVTNIAEAAFAGCYGLTGVYFKGNTPSVGQYVFDGYGYNHAIIYYLPGTTGWGATFGGRPTALWQPQVQTNDASFGVRTNEFGFTIAWTSGMVFVVEACTNLTNPHWSPLRTNTLTSDTFYFRDPAWTNYPARFYRLRSP